MKPERLAAKFRGALVGVAVGDALSAPFEGTGGADPQARDEVVAREPRSPIQVTAHPAHPPTAFSQARAETPAHIADRSFASRAHPFASPVSISRRVEYART